MKTPQGEQRKYQRIGVRIPAGVYLKDKPYDVIDAEILDISLGGAFVHCTALISIGQEVLVEIRFGETRLLDGRVIPHDQVDVKVPEASPEKSVIKWARGSSQSGFGVEFVGLHPDKRNFVERLVQYFETLKKAGVTFDSE